MKNLLGQKFGKLTVLERDLSRTGGAAYWICQCECGNKKSIRGTSLTSKKNPTRSCGCLSGQNMKDKIDLTSIQGQRFGRLTVIQRDLSKDYGHGKPSYWICKCDCGKQISVLKASLISKDTQSCGCLRKEKNSLNWTLDLTNKRYGSVIAIENTKEKDKLNRSYIWLCQCDCGNTFLTTAEYLQSGHINSCGCKRISSKGEETIKQILNDNNIHYAREYTFEDCRNPKTNYLYRYDFAILNSINQPVRLIEFDGIQHYYKENKWHFKVEEIQFNDNYKNNYALKNNIPLIRIPYWELENLTINDLLFSNKYIVK